MLRHAACLTAMLLCPLALSAATVTIDGSVEYQVMEGIGGYGSIYPSHQKSANPVYTSQFVDLLINDMGASMIRVQVPPAFEVTNDNGDPNNLDLSKFNLTETSGDNCKYRIRSISQEVPYWKALQQAAQENGEDIRIIATMWSPPWWMKVSNCVYGEDRATCKLKSTARAELAEYCEAFVRVFKQETGFDLYAFSFQNESWFTEPYQSCVYEEGEYTAAFEVIAAHFENKSLDVRFFGPEDMAQTVNLHYGLEFNASQAIHDHLYAYACHGYSNGVDPTPSSQAATVYRQVGGFANRTLGKPAWMTETSGYGTDWNGAMNKAEAMYTAMYYGNVAAWTRWTWTGEVLDNTTKHPQYAAYKHFARWTRPGAIRIDTQCDDDDVFVLAFNHKQNNTLTVILLNSGTATTAALTGANIPNSFQAFQSRQAGQYAPSIGAVQKNAISLPSNSMTTLYATGYEESGTSVIYRKRQRTEAAAQLPHAAARVTVYGLDGRIVDERTVTAAASSIPHQRAAAGRVTVYRDAHGRVLDTRIAPTAW